MQFAICLYKSVCYVQGHLYHLTWSLTHCQTQHWPTLFSFEYVMGSQIKRERQTKETFTHTHTLSHQFIICLLDFTFVLMGIGVSSSTWMDQFEFTFCLSFHSGLNIIIPLLCHYCCLYCAGLNHFHALNFSSLVSCALLISSSPHHSSSSFISPTFCIIGTTSTSMKMAKHVWN